jgi:NDP-sugar pyrophosphorylase family protein
MVKERISLTIDKELLKRIDSLVDRGKLRSRSHAIEYLATKALGLQRLNKALILAGGKGTRLRPITYEIPKPMIPIKGKPIMQYLINLLHDYGIEDIIISIGYLGERIKDYFGDGSKLGVKITYVEEKEELGTAGPLRLAKNLLNETFVAMNGDIITKIDLDDMFRFHREVGAKATIALTTVDDPRRYGIAEMRGSRILRFIEKPEIPPSNLINAGIYIMEPYVLKFIPKGYAMLEKDVFPKLAERGELAGYVYEGYWRDMGTLESYDQIIKELKDKDII